MNNFPSLPPGVRDRAAALLDGHLDVVPLRDAATVALLRDGSHGLEVYMQRRTSSLAFAAGMYVFPGGRVEEQDGDPRVPFAGQPPDPVPFVVGGDLILGRPAPAASLPTYRSLVAAAVRETAEEAGVLLAETEHGAPTRDEVAATCEALREQVPLAEALAAIGARIPWEGLVALSHWITPAVEVRRFDTRFFAALVPSGQHGHSASGETDDGGWVRPALMMQQAMAGEVVMLPPTVDALRELAAAPSAAAVLAGGHRQGLRPVLPHPYRDGTDIGWRLVDGYTGTPTGYL